MAGSGRSAAGRATSYAGTSGPPAGRPRFSTEERRLRWQTAAERTTASLEHWIVQSLDAATDAVLETAARRPDAR
ncbi:hypothetical protein Abr02nite_74860 [Paractinoplanes brasiliensis]|nr:hypothetical protein Abr02nite_74860 [Actinoplanes brasiliensis]